MNKCPHCGSWDIEPITDILYQCADCGRLSRGNPDFNRRLRDGFALSQASEDEHINPDWYLGRGSFHPEMDDPDDLLYVVEDE